MVGRCWCWVTSSCLMDGCFPAVLSSCTTEALELLIWRSRLQCEYPVWVTCGSMALLQRTAELILGVSKLLTPCSSEYRPQVVVPFMFPTWYYNGVEQGFWSRQVGDSVLTTRHPDIPSILMHWGTAGEICANTGETRWGGSGSTSRQPRLQVQHPSTRPQCEHLWVSHLLMMESFWADCMEMLSRRCGPRLRGGRRKWPSKYELKRMALQCEN